MMLILSQGMSDLDLLNAVSLEAYARGASGDDGTVVIPAWAVHRLVALGWPRVTLSYVTPRLSFTVDE